MLQLSRATGCFILSKSRVWVWVRVVSAGWWVLGAVPVWGMQAQVGFYMAGGKSRGRALRQGVEEAVGVSGVQVGRWENVATQPRSPVPPLPLNQSPSGPGTRSPVLGEALWTLPSDSRQMGHHVSTSSGTQAPRDQADGEREVGQGWHRGVPRTAGRGWLGLRLSRLTLRRSACLTRSSSRPLRSPADSGVRPGLLGSRAEGVAGVWDTSM